MKRKSLKVEKPKRKRTIKYDFIPCYEAVVINGKYVLKSDYVLNER